MFDSRHMGTLNICMLLKLIHWLHYAETSSWVQWVRRRVCTATLNGDLHGAHWEVLRSLLPMYQAIALVQFGDGESTSFCLYIWSEENALADRFPILFSHCKDHDTTVKHVVATMLVRALVPQLSLQEMRS